MGAAAAAALRRASSVAGSSATPLSIAARIVLSRLWDRMTPEAMAATLTPRTKSQNQSM
ncbi:MAG: hypothetical protein WDN03_12255 [Rhizomicrobium sp.]